MTILLSDGDKNMTLVLGTSVMTRNEKEKGNN